MSFMTRITADDTAFADATARATTRARHSCFPQHIVRDDDGTIWVADEGDYEALIDAIRPRIVTTIPAGRDDES